MLSAKEARLRVREFENSTTAQTLRDIELAIIRAADRGLAKIRHPTYVEPDYNQIISILKEQGYSVKVGEIVKGKCVTHEVDVIALADHHHFMIECKYHNMLHYQEYCLDVFLLPF